MITIGFYYHQACLASLASDIKGITSMKEGKPFKKQSRINYI
jgi:hypothetical protein